MSTALCEFLICSTTEELLLTCSLKVEHSNFGR